MLMKDRMNMIKAIIFDMDGVIVDSMPVYYEIYNEILSSYGKHIPLESFSKRCGGLPFLKIMELEGVTDAPETLLAEKELKLTHKFSETIKPIPGIYDILDLPLTFAIASGAPKKAILRTITELNIIDKISGVSSGYEVPRPKPAPDIWIDVAHKISVAPSNCIIIEDSPAGVQGAKEAGMITIGLVPNSSTNIGADYHVTSLFDAKRIIEELISEQVTN